MFEKLRDLAFEKHTYKHTTIGFVADIKAMPGYYDYSRQFFNRFYRPENVVVLVVGDVQPQKVADMAKQYYSDWKPGYKAADIVPEPPQKAPKKAHLDWPNPTRPYVLVGYHTPAFSTKTVDSAALNMIGDLLFSESAPLYQDLVVDKQWADVLDGDSGRQRDPSLFEIEVRTKSEDLLPKVKEAIDREIARLQQGEIDAERLARIKSSLRNSFILSLDTPASVARQVARIVSLSGDVNDINRLYAQYQKVTPADVQRLAREVFRRDNETVVTLSHAAQAKPASQPGGAHD
jgi:zinc protease